jgi:ABC-type sugar transport system substrate-binding protein
MNRTTILTTAAAGLLAAAGMFAAATVAKDEPAPAAQNTTTVWVDGQGQSSFATKVNKMHADMEAKGWKFGDLAVYTEDGDMQGAFVTYVR